MYRLVVNLMIYIKKKIIITLCGKIFYHALKNGRHPFVENQLGLPERTNDAAGAYAKACVSVANECGIPVIDLWNKMQKFPDWQKAYLR